MHPIPTLLIVTLLLASSCKKDDEAQPAPDGNAGPTAVWYTLAESDAVLTAYRSRSWMNGTVSGDTVAYAMFQDEFDQGASVGQVFLNGTELNDSMEVSGSLMYLGHGNYATTSDLGLDLSGETLNWSVSGNAVYPDFSIPITDITFPVVDTVNSSAFIDKSVGYTLSCEALSGADSVTFSIAMGPHRTVAGNMASCTFTPSELAGMPTGVSNVSITADAYTGRDIGGKKILFNKSTSTRRTAQVVD